MKRDSHVDDDNRFRGRVKHYHRSAEGPPPTWEDWAKGTSARKKRWPWGRILLIAFGAAALIGVLAALFVEFRPD